MFGAIKAAVRRRLPMGMILLYHRVAEPATDPQLLCVSPDNFRSHLQSLCRDYTPVALGEMVSQMASGRLRPRSFAITFDDGYADNLHNAWPIAQECGVPITCFVVTKQVEEARGFWWDELESIFLRLPELPESLELEIGGQVKHYAIAGAGPVPADWTVLQPTDHARALAYKDIARSLRTLPGEQRSRVLDQLWQWAGLSPVTPDGQRPLSRAETAELAAKAHDAVGAHTQSHPLLSGLERSQQQQEIVTGKQGLERIAKRTINTFSYPFGGRNDYNADSVSLVKEAGFSCAVSNFPGFVRSDTDHFQLPRFLVRDWGQEFFHGQMESWLRR